MSSFNINYYALWYYFPEGERTTNAISLDQESLWDLHITSINNKECMIHTYLKNIFRIEVNTIQCYKYNNKEKILELLNENNNTSEKEGAFYAMQKYITVNTYTQHKIFSEVLIYLTKEDHKIWRDLSSNNNNKYTEDSLYPQFFYEELISLNPITPDVYYEEGIMNA